MKTATIDSVPISQWIVLASIPQHFVTRHLKYEKNSWRCDENIQETYQSAFSARIFTIFPTRIQQENKKKMQPCELSTSFSLFQWRYYLIIKINISMVPHQHRTVQLFYRKTGIVASLIFFLFKTLNSERVWGAQFKKNNIGSILLTCMYFKMFEQ